MEPWEYDATNVKPSAGWDPAPPGLYHLIIREVTEKMTRNNDLMYNVECEIDDREQLGKKVWHNVTFLQPGAKGAGMAIHFLKVIGQPWEGKIIINPSAWIGKVFLAKLGVTQDLKGRNRNEVVSVEYDGAPPETPPQPPAAPVASVADDNVPF